MSLVGDLNARIAQFVTAKENRCLRPGTGGYSTPFRGGLFGKLRASEVDAELASGRTADVLFLGANPNCPESLAAIQQGGEGDWKDFERQVTSDEFGHVAPEGGRWDPLHDPGSLKSGQRAWALYAAWLGGAVGGLDTVALANILPWVARTWTPSCGKRARPIPACRTAWSCSPTTCSPG
jgi:hypothetical protein